MCVRERDLPNNANDACKNDAWSAAGWIISFVVHVSIMCFDHLLERSIASNVAADANYVERVWKSSAASIPTPNLSLASHVLWGGK